MSTPSNWPPTPPPPSMPMPPAVPAGTPAYAPTYAPVPQPKKSSAVPIVVILIVVIFGGLFVVGIIAAIAIPSLLRARVSANEAAAINTLRTMVSAEVTWARMHEGRYAQPACLAEPASCGDQQMSSLVTREIGGLGPRSGYVFGFLLRPDAGTSETGIEPGVSPPGAPTDAEVRAQLEQFSTPDTGAAPAPPLATVPSPRPDLAFLPPSDRGFVVWATPQMPGRSGIRTFCIDETGAILVYDFDATWTGPAVDNPRCPETGTPLR